MVTVPCLSSPAFSVASDRSQVARRRVRLDLGDLGIIDSNSTRARTSLVPKPLPSCDAFASDWSIPRTPGSVSSSHHPSPLQEQRTTGHTQSALHSALQCMGRTLALNAWQVLFLYVSKYQACFFSRPTTRRYEIDLATHRASQGHAQS